MGCSFGERMMAASGRCWQLLYREVSQFNECRLLIVGRIVDQHWRQVATDHDEVASLELTDVLRIHQWAFGDRFMRGLAPLWADTFAFDCHGRGAQQLRGVLTFGLAHPWIKEFSGAVCQNGLC